MSLMRLRSTTYFTESVSIIYGAVLYDGLRTLVADLVMRVGRLCFYVVGDGGDGGWGSGGGGGEGSCR